jgi:hypothetical protein
MSRLIECSTNRNCSCYLEARTPPSMSTICGRTPCMVAHLTTKNLLFSRSGRCALVGKGLPMALSPPPLFFLTKTFVFIFAGRRGFQLGTAPSFATIRHERRKASSSVRSLLYFIVGNSNTRLLVVASVCFSPSFASVPLERTKIASLLRALVRTCSRYSSPSTLHMIRQVNSPPLVVPYSCRVIKARGSSARSSSKQFIRAQGLIFLETGSRLDLLYVFITEILVRRLLHVVIFVTVDVLGMHAFCMIWQSRTCNGLEAMFRHC